MQVWWFFATTPVPQLPGTLRDHSTRSGSARSTWWRRAADRFVAWGERSAQRHITRSMYY